MKKRIKLKKWVRVALIFIIVILFMISINLITSSVGTKNKNKVIYSYNALSKLDYKVELYDNSFIDKKYIEKGQSYISDLVKNIDVNFIYNFSGTKKIDLEYEYNVTADIQGEYQLEDDSSKVWNKNYTLLDTKKNKIAGTQFNINEKVNVDYNFYDSVVSDFRKELKLPITSNLNVIFNVKVKGIIDGKKLDENQDIKMIIPLNVQAFKITEELDENNIKNINEQEIEQTKINYKKLIAGIIVMMMNVFIVYLTIRDILNIPKKNYYNSQKSKLLKEYDDVIVEIVTPISRKDLSIVEVKNFDEMIDLEEELRIPITFYEIEPDEMGEFVIVNNNIFYRYLLINEED